MARAILGVVAGLLVWLAIVAVAGVVMRGAWADYAAVADAMTFTLPMMVARLSIGALATVAAGWVAGLIARGAAIARLAPGVILLLLFIPQHYLLWDKFPIWYHLTFLGSLVPLTWLGGKLASRSRGAAARSAG